MRAVGGEQVKAGPDSSGTQQGSEVLDNALRQIRIASNMSTSNRIFKLSVIHFMCSTRADNWKADGRHTKPSEAMSTAYARNLIMASATICGSCTSTREV